MGLEEREAVFELHLEGVARSKIARVAKPAELRCAEWHLQSIPRFHAVTDTPLDDGEFAALGQLVSRRRSHRDAVITDPNSPVVLRASEFAAAGWQRISARVLRTVATRDRISTERRFRSFSAARSTTT